MSLFETLAIRRSPENSAPEHSHSTQSLVLLLADFQVVHVKNLVYRVTSDAGEEGLFIRDRPSLDADLLPHVTHIGKTVRFYEFSTHASNSSAWGRFENGSWSCVEGDISGTHRKFVAPVKKPCPKDTFVQEGNSLCIYECKGYHLPDDQKCSSGCPSGTEYYTPKGVCYKRCPAGYVRGPGSLACEELSASSLPTSDHTVLLQKDTKVYYHRLAPSFAEVRWLAQSSGQLFLEAGPNVIALRVAATTRLKISYAPALFVQGGTLLQCSLEFTATDDKGSALIGHALLGPLRLEACALFFHSDTAVSSLAAVRLQNGHELVLHACELDLPGDVFELVDDNTLRLPL